MKHFYGVTGYVLLVFFFCSGCATIFNGTKQQITIDSKPQGATVKIKDQVIGTTPLSVRQPTKKPLTIVFSHERYEDRAYLLDHKYEWRWLLLDVPFTFPYVNVPFAIDVITQSPYRFVQEEVMMNFDSVYSPPIPLAIDSAEVYKQRIIDLEILQTQKEIEELNKKERILLAEESRNRKLKSREEKIRLRQMQDSAASEINRRSYDSSRVHNYRNTMRFKNSVTMELTSLLIGESRMEYHRNIYKGISLGIELGYKPAQPAQRTYSNQREWIKDGPGKEIMLMPFSESYYIGLATKIPLFSLGRGQYYFSLVGFIRNSSYDHATISWEEGKDRRNYYSGVSYKDSVGVDQNSQGLKFLLGYSKILVVGRIGLEFDAYSGFGCRNVTTELFHYEKKTTHSYYYNTPPTVITNEAEKTEQFVLTVQMGVKVGIRF